MPLYQFKFRREQSATVLIEAADKDEAEVDADCLSELVADDEWTEDLFDLEGPFEFEEQPTVRYWTGGPGGHWQTPEEN